MKTNPNTGKFLTNMINTASPSQLIVILYDGAIQWIQMAKKEIDKNQKLLEEKKAPSWSDFAHQTKMANKILDHLQDSLNFEESKEFSEKLYALYDFLKSQITRACLDKSPEKLDTVIKFLKDLKISWTQAIKNEGSKKTNLRSGSLA
jgi:flagellar secretion chaperone FliS